MEVKTFRIFEFYSIHSVTAFGEDSPYRKKHIHKYKVTVWVKKKLDPGNFVTVNFDDIEKAWLPIYQKFNNTDLDESFYGNSTTEVLTVYIQGQMGLALGLPVEVQVMENETCGVEIRE